MIAARKILFVLFVLICSFVVFPVGQSASAASFGAIAFSQDTGGWGYSYNYRSRGAAQRRAMNECRSKGRGCRVIVWFRNACGALAVGRGNAYGWGWDAIRNRARGRALSACRARAGGCQIRVDVCSR